MNSAYVVILIVVLVILGVRTGLARAGWSLLPAQRSIVRSYIGDREMERGIEQMARRGYAVQSHTTTLIGRGAKKFAIGYLAAQKTRHTVVFVRSA